MFALVLSIILFLTFLSISISCVPTKVYEIAKLPIKGGMLISGLMRFQKLTLIDLGRRGGFFFLKGCQEEGGRRIVRAVEGKDSKLTRIYAATPMGERI
jgi:hypothetical protein